MQDNQTPYNGNLWTNYTTENIVEMWKQKLQEFQSCQGDTSFHTLTASDWCVFDEDCDDPTDERFWQPIKQKYSLDSFDF